MASKRMAGMVAKKKSRQVFRTNRRKSKRSVLKRFANFVGKVAYKATRMKRSRKRGRSRRRRMSFRRRRY